MPNLIAIGEWLMATVYILLVGVWFIVLIKTDDIFRLRRPTLPSESATKIQFAFRIVALTLLVDSVYWATTNIAQVMFHRGLVLRNPFFVAIVKIPVLISAVIFYRLVERSSDALREEYEQAYFSKLLDLTWDAVGILDVNGNMKIWNKGAENLFHWKRNEVLDKNIKDFLVPPDLAREIDEALDEVKTNHVAQSLYNTIRLTANGERIPIDISISPIMNPEFKGYFGIMRKALPLPFGDFRYFAPSDVPRHADSYVFVAMPFSADVVPHDVYSVAIRDAIESNSLIAIRADHGTLTGSVINQIYNDIRQATLVVADLTGRNPNVFYEVGLAHMLGKPVIQLMGDGDDIPFDIAHIRTIKYSFHQLSDLREKLKNALRDHLAVHKPESRHSLT
jgi:PAS domain S-box-containing protein